MPQYHWHPQRGEWRPSSSIPAQGWKAKLEQWFYKKNMIRLGEFMGRWDERGLGR